MGYRILVVDDASFIRQQLSTFIESLGHEVVALGKNGLDAIDLYKRERPDLVFMDLTMPVLDGAHAIESILKVDKGARIVVVSSVTAEINQAYLRQMGVIDFIKKPFTKEDVQDTLSKVINQ